MSDRHIFCSKCGAQGEAGCDCGAEYISASAFAAKALARNPEKSNRAIAAEIGVDDKTVAKARHAAGADNSAPGKRQGQDGKMYPSKSKSQVTRRAKPEELEGYSPKAKRHIDVRTGENISHHESAKREAVHAVTGDLESEVIELRATVKQLTFELSQRPAMDDLRRIDAVARHVQRITTDIDTYNLLRRCLHPDSRSNISDELLHKAWLAFSKLEPLTYDKSKIPPPLPKSLDDLWRMREEATQTRKKH
jgi:hypothetical protein